MDILYLLIPLSAVLVLGIVAVFGWAVYSGQFDELEREGQRLIAEDPDAFDGGQGSREVAPQQSPGRPE
ncbi:MAG: cbb3-type cytochrome oxidase assembly protein CcoS [Rubrivivax sp.]